jgi:hypothetical protein
VRVNGIAPGQSLTRTTTEEWRARERGAGNIPLRRFGRVRGGLMAVYLCLDAGTSRADVPADGGAADPLRRVEPPQSPPRTACDADALLMPT